MTDFKAQKPASDFKVLIKCNTYNQAKYIEDALNGFVRQQTDFLYCAVIVDDASTDGEREVLIEYLRKYFDTQNPPLSIKEETDDYTMTYARHKENRNCLFAVFFLKYNHYRKKPKNPYFKSLQQQAQYVSLCEGDDYWIDDRKLQRQVDFLDSHPDYMLYFHNALVRYQNQDHPDHLISNFQTDDFNTAQIFEKWQLPLASVMFRKDIYEATVKKELDKVYPGGFNLFITASRIGKVYGLSECLSVYRRNEGGVSNKMTISEVVERHYKYARITGDKKVVSVVDNEAKWNFVFCFVDFLKRKPEAIKLANVVKKNNSLNYYNAFYLYFLHKIKGLVKRHVFLMSLLLLLFLLFILINNKVPQWSYSYYNSTYESSEGLDITVFESNVRNASYSLISEESWGGKSRLSRKKSLLDWMLALNKKGANVYSYGEFGYLMHYAYLYGQSKNDVELCSLVREKFDAKVLGGG